VKERLHCFSQNNYVIGCFHAILALIYHKGQFFCILNILDLYSLMKCQPTSLEILTDATIQREAFAGKFWVFLLKVHLQRMMCHLLQPLHYSMYKQ